MKYPENKTVDVNPHKSGSFPSHYKRREVLTLLALSVGLGLTYAFVKTSSDVSKRENELPFNWNNYYDNYLPPEILSKFGEHLINEQNYQGFHEVGEIITLSQINPLELRQYYPYLQYSIGVKFKSLLEESMCISKLHSEYIGTGSEIEFKDKNTEELYNAIFAEPKKVSLTIELDNSFATASDSAKKLVIAKEYSQLLYTNIHKNIVVSNILGNYELTKKPLNINNIEEFLYFNALINESLPKISSLEDSFDNALIDLQGAGYWHIMSAFGKMKRSGNFSEKDLIMLDVVDYIFEKAKTLGYLLETQKNKFNFRSEIDPFSLEWKSIIRPILN